MNDSEVRKKYVIFDFTSIRANFDFGVKDKITRESAESTDLIKHRLKEFSDHVSKV